MSDQTVQDMDPLSADNEMNFVDLNDPKQYQIYQRRMVAGEKIRLPNTPTVTDEMWYTFEHGFMQLKDDTGERSKVFRYFWEPESAEVTALTVPYGVAGNITQLVKLIESNRIQRDMIKVDNVMPTSNIWTKVKKLTAATYAMKEIKVEATVQTPKTPTPELKTVDAIVNYLTNDYYVIPAEIQGGDPGLITKLYFDDFETNLKIIRKAYCEGKDYLPYGMTECFKSGMYADYKQTVAAVKRRYGRCKSQDTMMDLFRKLDRAFSERTRHEFKIGNLRNILQKYYITKDFPTCSDFENDSISQTTKEEYSPIINTLLSYIIFDKSIDRKRWDAVQREYHHTMNGKPTYKSWHENRPELYKIMDSELHLDARQQSAVSEIQAPDEDISAVQTRRQQQLQQQRRQQQQRQQPQRPQQRFQPAWNQGRNIQTPRRNNSNNNDLKKRLQHLLCRHCSKWAGENRYHTGIKGTGPNSSCPYDANGRIRPNRKFIGRIAGVEVNEVGVEDYRSSETDDFEYFDPDEEVEEVEPDQPDLLSKALEPYCT